MLQLLADARSYPLRTFAGLHGFVCDWRLLPDASAPTSFASLQEGMPLSHCESYPLPLAVGRARARDGCGVATALCSDRPRDVTLWFGAFAGYRAWLDGVPIGNRGQERDLRVEQACVPVRLPAGLALLRLQVDREVSPAFCVRVTGLGGEPAEGIAVALPADGGAPGEEDRAASRPHGYFQARFAEPGTHSAEGLKPDAWPQWRRDLAARLSELIGEPPAPTGAVDERGVAECDGYRRVDLSFPGAIGPVPAWLLLPHRPAGGRALLCLHGHGRGRADVVGDTDGTPAAEQALRRTNYDYAAQAARRGYVVLAPEFAGFGARADPSGTFGGRDRCDASFLRALMLGENLLGIHLAEARAALGVLLSRPEVDAQRVGCLGLSFGGRMAMFLAATDERVRACVSSGALNTFRERLMAGKSCGAQFVPGLLGCADTPEVFGMIAPRALFLELGTADDCCPEIFALDAYRRVERVYRAAGCEDRLGLHVFSGGHRFSGERAWEWLERWL